MEVVEIEFLKNLYYTISILLIICLIVSFGVYMGENNNFKNVKYFILILFSLIIALQLGNREIGVGTDTATYYFNFKYVFRLMDKLTIQKDPLWDIFNYFVSRFTDNVSVLFVFVAILYIFLPIFGVNKYLHQNSIYFLILFLISPNFFLYGANGIRNGLAASLFLFSLRYHNQKKQIIWLSFSVLLHASMLIPVLVYKLVSKKIQNLKIYFGFWLILFVTAILNINMWNYIPLDIDRLNQYLDSSEGQSESNKILNIPVNFLIYSIAPILLSYYLLVNKKIKDEFYTRLSITYLVGSYVYILSFHLKFAARFAYISEFLMPFLLIYPLVKYKLLKYSEIKIVLILIIVFLIKAFKILSI